MHNWLLGANNNPPLISETGPASCLREYKGLSEKPSAPGLPPAALRQPQWLHCPEGTTQLS